MHTVELLEEALKTARKQGYTVRQDWLSGAGGACEIKGQRVLFVDLSLSALEQLDQVLAAIQQASTESEAISPPIQHLLDRAKIDRLKGVSAKAA